MSRWTELVRVHGGPAALREEHVEELPGAVERGSVRALLRHDLSATWRSVRGNPTRHTSPGIIYPGGPSTWVILETSSACAHDGPSSSVGARPVYAAYSSLPNPVPHRHVLITLRPFFDLFARAPGNQPQRWRRDRPGERTEVIDIFSPRRMF